MTKVKITNSPLLTKYKEVMPELKKELAKDNDFAVPKMEKVVINTGVGNHHKDDKYIDFVAKSIAQISGQKPIKTLAKTSIAGFKIREGAIVGVKVTLRGERMYHFINKLISVALPRVRDFRGLSLNGFDPQGNYTLGMKEHIVFPEVLSDSVDTTFPLEITVVTSAKNASDGKLLLTKLGFPFKEQE